jgi:hypothetical protein
VTEAPRVAQQEISMVAAKALAARFGGDCGADDSRHFGRLASFTNRKANYLGAGTGLYPLVRLIEAEGGVHPEAERFLTGVKSDLEHRRGERQEARMLQLARLTPVHSTDLKSVDAFRSDGSYGGDRTLIDLERRRIPAAPVRIEAWQTTRGVSFQRSPAGALTGWSIEEIGSGVTEG